MAAATTEQALAAMIKAAVAPVQFKWGWAPLESANLEPTLPLVVLVRTVALAAPYADMCEAGKDIKADTTVAIHCWARTYEVARALAAVVRTAANDAHGWALQAESDQYDGAFRAWLITSDWLSTGLALR